MNSSVPRACDLIAETYDEDMAEMQPSLLDKIGRNRFRRGTSKAVFIKIEGLVSEDRRSRI